MNQSFKVSISGHDFEVKRDGFDVQLDCDGKCTDLWECEAYGHEVAEFTYLDVSQTLRAVAKALNK